MRVTSAERKLCLLAAAVVVAVVAYRISLSHTWRGRPRANEPQPRANEASTGGRPIAAEAFAAVDPPESDSLTGFANVHPDSTYAKWNSLQAALPHAGPAKAYVASLASRFSAFDRIEIEAETAYMADFDGFKAGDTTKSTYVIEFNPPSIKEVTQGEGRSITKTTTGAKQDVTEVENGVTTRTSKAALLPNPFVHESASMFDAILCWSQQEVGLGETLKYPDENAERVELLSPVGKMVVVHYGEPRVEDEDPLPAPGSQFRLEEMVYYTTLFNEYRREKVVEWRKHPELEVVLPQLFVKRTSATGAPGDWTDVAATRWTDVRFFAAAAAGAQ